MYLFLERGKIHKSNKQEKIKQCGRYFFISKTRIFFLLKLTLSSKVFTWLSVSVGGLKSTW